MPVVINEFEVMPAPQASETRSGGAQAEETGEKKKSPISDLEAQKMIKRALERSERVSAH